MMLLQLSLYKIYMNENSRLLNLLHFDPSRGFTGLRELQRRTAIRFGIGKDEVADWYRRQAVHQIIIPHIPKLYYHYSIGNGRGIYSYFQNFGTLF